MFRLFSAPSFWSSGVQVQVISNFKEWGCGIFSNPSINLLMAPSVIDFDGSQTLESFDVDFLRKCTAVFFAGGDQNRITDLMEKVPGLRELFIAAYNQVMFSLCISIHLHIGHLIMVLYRDYRWLVQVLVLQ